ncbi:MAG: type II secretion system F family protein [Planctomycetaceae bacterium]|nr:type II secretion system F family protein [Planctomycetaceae bacterium]
MTYAYRVRDPLGNIFDGTIQALNVDDAAQQLRSDGFQVLEIDEDSDPFGALFARRITKKDLIFVTSQLAIMVDTGVTLSAALAGMSEQEQNPSLRKVLEELRQSVEEGEDFSTALSHHPKLFDKTFIALVRASEAAGDMGGMLERIAGYMRAEVDTVGKVRAAMAYPAVMMFMAIGVTIFLLTYILPKFTPIFRSRGTELPTPTKVMMGISDALLDHWYFWVAGLVLAIAAYLFGRRTDAGRRILDTTKIHLPILGSLFRKVTISRSIRTLGTMLASGVPMLDSLKLCGEVSGNYQYESLWAKVRDEVTGGRRICEVLKGTPLIPPVLVQMIASGEETGKLDLVLERVSSYYDREVEMAVKTATSLIEPIMIAGMGFVVGGIGMALLLPIFSLSRQT